VNRTYLAFDLGAESGRAILAQMTNGRLDLREIRRFANEPVRSNGSLHWDVLRLWHEMTQTLASDALPSLASVGVDGWGVDYALIGERGNLLENPYHYRDRRNDGMMQAVFERASRERIYSTTGIQFLQINTLFQLYAACTLTPDVIDAARALVTIPDLFNYWLSGRICSEYTVATTTQLVDARTRTWATRLLDEIGLPTRLLPEIVQPGSIIGTVRSEAIPSILGVPIVVPACHDTGSAVASVHTGAATAFISSGTWSLLGTELDAPIMTTTARDLNFTNEGGVNGTIRLLKNIGGLWLLQGCRRAWAKEGSASDYDTLLASAADDRLAFASLVDPDYQGFLNPEHMPSEIAQYCRLTSQREPASAAAYVRTILESLALKYRVVLESLEEITDRQFDHIRVVGGGSRNRLLNQLTADATGRTVLSGPIEATALGNIAIQMVATGAVDSLAEARTVIERSFPVERFEPHATERWDAPYRRFRDYLEFTCA
jgi:rhamnulokinase